MQDAANGRYTFAVDLAANKPQIANEVAKTFAVKVLSVRTIVVKGKTHRSGKLRLEMKTGSWKKAIVELEKGQKIDLFDVTDNAKKT